MGIDKILHRFEAWLGGWPNSALSVILIALGVLLIVTAFLARPHEKAIVAAWVLFP